MRNLPDKTLSRRMCKVGPSNGSAPQTKTYNTTPKLCNRNLQQITYVSVFFKKPKKKEKKRNEMVGRSFRL